MGRPPIGKIAMTVAERVRKHRLKRHAETTVTKHVTKQDVADAGTAASLEARILELEAELAHERREHAATDQRWRAAFVAPYVFAGVT
jgi:hypothetical protein